MFLQKTIRQKVQVRGVGLHSGQSCALNFVPAPAGQGVHFVRRDLPGSPRLLVHANHVSATSYATTLSGPEFSVSTIEHCVSALAALRVDNLDIELDGPEIPIVDGSAAPFLRALQSVGVCEQDQPRTYLAVVKPLEVRDGDKWARVSPYQGLRLTVEIDFAHPAVGKQKLDVDVNETSFSREIAPARTFGFLKDVEALRVQGLIKGGGLENAIVLSDTGVVNSEGLRFPDEFVRHKALDALGDLVTLGRPLLGHFESFKAGHDLHQKLVKAILNNPEHGRPMELGSQDDMDLTTLRNSAFLFIRES